MHTVLDGGNKKTEGISSRIIAVLATPVAGNMPLYPETVSVLRAGVEERRGCGSGSGRVGLHLESEQHKLWLSPCQFRVSPPLSWLLHLFILLGSQIIDDVPRPSPLGLVGGATPP